MIKLAVLGAGCPKCIKLAQNAETAAKALGVDYELEKVTYVNKIMGFGVMMTPALVVDGSVMVSGRVPSVEDINKLIG